MGREGSRALESTPELPSIADVFKTKKKNYVKASFKDVRDIYKSHLLLVMDSLHLSLKTASLDF